MARPTEEQIFDWLWANKEDVRNQYTSNKWDVSNVAGQRAAVKDWLKAWPSEDPLDIANKYAGDKKLTTPWGGGASGGGNADAPNYTQQDVFNRMNEYLGPIRAKNGGAAFTREDYVAAGKAAGLSDPDASSLAGQYFGFQAANGRPIQGFDDFVKLATAANISWTPRQPTLVREQWEAEQKRLKEQADEDKRRYEADKAERQKKYDDDKAERLKEFNAKLDIDQRTMGLSEAQAQDRRNQFAQTEAGITSRFNATQAQAQSQFDTNTANQVSQFAQRFGLDQQAQADLMSRFGVTEARANKEFGVTSGQKQQEITNQNKIRWAEIIASQSGPRDYRKMWATQSNLPPEVQGGNMDLMTIANNTPAFGATKFDPNNSWDTQYQKYLQGMNQQQTAGSTGADTVQQGAPVQQGQGGPQGAPVQQGGYQGGPQGAPVTKEPYRLPAGTAPVYGQGAPAANWNQMQNAWQPGTTAGVAERGGPLGLPVQSGGQAAGGPVQRGGPPVGGGAPPMRYNEGGGPPVGGGGNMGNQYQEWQNQMGNQQGGAPRQQGPRGVPQQAPAATTEPYRLSAGAVPAYGQGAPQQAPAPGTASDWFGGTNAAPAAAGGAPMQGGGGGQAASATPSWFGQPTQPNQISRSQYGNMSPTLQQGMEGDFAANAIDPKDAWAKMRAAWTTGNAATRTRWR